MDGILRVIKRVVKEAIWNVAKHFFEKRNLKTL